MKDGIEITWEEKDLAYLRYCPWVWLMELGDTKKTYQNVILIGRSTAPNSKNRLASPIVAVS
jgi:hypothetical protein